MTDRYMPNGRPAGAYERELLVILMEECAEITQVAAKMLRFGVDNIAPRGDTSNHNLLAGEIGDLKAVIELMIGCGLIDERMIADGQARKQKRLDRYLQTGVPAR